ncbi:DegV family protein [Arenicella xantha]|uniref:Fatty acid-binding protein DegV n=1 Tax=Arenicella xantha TaxID=644221 RepID=A0A395JMK4_9GAMM|nr:DegV family protein [Arenicella xantha]RBP51067.1 fatty acid-binding protein DegV [Arenicella xantha]
MSYTIIIDSSAQLPESYIKDRPITVLPLHISLNGNVFSDRISENKLIDIYNSGEITVDAQISSEPITTGELIEFMVEKIIPNYDTAICQTIAKAHSATYDNYTNAINSILIESRRLRAAQDLPRPFRMTYMSTGNTSTGQGLVAAYADALVSRGYEFNKYKSQIEKFKVFAKSYTTIKDMVYGRHKSKQRGVSSVSYPTAVIMNKTGVVPIVCNNNEKMWVIGLQPKFEKAVNRIFRYAIERIKEGLYFNTIIVSIADDTGRLDNFSEYSKLISVAQQAGVQVLVNVMTLTIASNYGPGSFSLGIAPKNSKVEP